MRMPAIFRRKALQEEKSKEQILEDGSTIRRLSHWRHGGISKAFTVVSSGGGKGLGFFWEPPPETQTLPEDWYIDDNGFFTRRFPQIKVEQTDFEAAEREAFPAYITAARLTEQTSFTRHQMNAYWVGLRFHHWMGRHVSGFWDVFDLKRNSYPGKVFRLEFEGQGEITFYGTHKSHSAGRGPEGATLIVKEAGVEYPLLYESSLCNEICYPGDRNKRHVAFNLPAKGVIADNIITAFAIVHAAGRMIRDQRLIMPPKEEKAPQKDSAPLYSLKRFDS